MSCHQQIKAGFNCNCVICKLSANIAANHILTYDTFNKCIYNHISWEKNQLQFTATRFWSEPLDSGLHHKSSICQSNNVQHLKLIDKVVSTKFLKCNTNLSKVLNIMTVTFTNIYKYYY